jgi:molybdate transport system ATP-binding protein
MSAELIAHFEKRFANGPTIAVELCVPVEGFGITVLFGPSGAGKTTVLRCLSGVERPDSGRICFGEETWFDAGAGAWLPPQQRGVGYVTQDYGLFPHLTVAGNVAYGLGGLGKVERRRRVGEVFEALGLSGLADRRPRELSGGEQQRIALARAVVRRPRLLLLDEPLGALDAPTRVRVRGQLRRWLAAWRIPAMLVTHDRIEALALADTVMVLEGGRVLQAGPTAEVFGHPVSAAAARLVGVENVEPARLVGVRDGLATVVVGNARLTAVADEAVAGDCYACIRAEDVTLEKGSPAGSTARNRLAGRVTGLMPEGPLVRVGVDCGFALSALITHQACMEIGLSEGDSVVASIKAPAVRLVPRG